jgi:hypothetical protein
MMSISAREVPLDDLELMLRGVRSFLDFRAIERRQAGETEAATARSFNVNQSTILRLVSAYTSAAYITKHNLTAQLRSSEIK